jgi:hypothetical protein
MPRARAEGPPDPENGTARGGAGGKGAEKDSWAYRPYTDICRKASEESINWWQPVAREILFAPDSFHRLTTREYRFVYREWEGFGHRPEDNELARLEDLAVRILGAERLDD